MGDTQTIAAEAEILIVSVGRRRLEVIKVVQILTGLPRREVADRVDRPPFTILVPAGQVNDFARPLVTSGAIIEIGAVTPTLPPPPVTRDRFDDLERLGRLHTDGVISDDEFAAAKKRVLDTI